MLRHQGSGVSGPIRRMSSIGLAGGAPSWVLRGAGVAATLDIDFVNNQAWNSPASASIASLLTCTRASTGYYTKADGTLTTFLSNVLRYGTNGLLLEAAKTNVVLWNRDLTNGVWTASSCTVAKDQTGNDGTVNGASSLTAVGANATVLQSITLASSARFQSAWVKRLNGSGTINMTMDNGSTWTAIVPTGTWTKLIIPTQTMANPTVGFRIVTSGDAIAVDFVQNENSGLFSSSPIPTTTVGVTRAADAIQILLSAIAGFSTSVGSMYAQAKTLGALTSQGIAQITKDGNNAIIMAWGNGSSIPRLRVDSGGSNTFLSDCAAVSADVLTKLGMAWTTNDAASYQDGSQKTTDSSVTVPSGLTTLYFGAAPGWYGTPDHYLTRFAYWNSRISNAALQATTT